MEQASQAPVVAVPHPRALAGRRRLDRDRLIGILIISPSVIAIAVFVYYFIARTAYVSLVRWNDLAPDYTWVGKRNYERLFQNERFHKDLWNTLKFTGVFIPACLVIGLLLATLLDQRIKGEAIFRTIFMFPVAISFIVTGVVWRWLETPTSGINLLFDKVGLGFLQVGMVHRPIDWHLCGGPCGGLADVRLRDGDVSRRSARYPR